MSRSSGGFETERLYGKVGTGRDQGRVTLGTISDRNRGVGDKDHCAGLNKFVLGLNNGKSFEGEGGEGEKGERRERAKRKRKRRAFAAPSTKYERLRSCG